jgi:hypothetical protein
VRLCSARSASRRWMVSPWPLLAWVRMFCSIRPMSGSSPKCGGEVRALKVSWAPGQMTHSARGRPWALANEGLTGVTSGQVLPGRPSWGGSVRRTSPQRVRVAGEGKMAPGSLWYLLGGTLPQPECGNRNWQIGSS